MSLSPLVNELEKRILSKTVHHGGHPLLRHAIDAVDLELDAAGNRKPSRANRTRKIDALIAVLLALDRQLREPPPPPPAEYQLIVLGPPRDTWRRIVGFDFKWAHRVIVDPRDRGKIFITTFGGSVWYGNAN